MEAVSERKDGDDAQDIPAPCSSGFTAINQATQLLTPRSSATAPNQARRRATSNGRRRHNPAVAQYLGRGSSNEPTHLEKYAPLPAVPESPPSRPVRKRRRLADGKSILGRTRISSDDKDALNQRLVSENFRVTKPTRKSASARSKIPILEAPQLLSAYSSESHTSLADQSLDSIPRQSQPVHVAYQPALKIDTPSAARTPSQETVTALDFEDPTDHQLFDVETDDHSTNGSTQFESTSPQRQIGDSALDEDRFNDDINDDDLLMLTTAMDDTVFYNADHLSSSLAKPSTANGHNGHSQSPGPSANTATNIDSSHHLSKMFVSPVTSTTRVLAATSDRDSVEARKPIVRPSFPDSVRDRSPIIGLSSCTMLRTCFRIGEAINQSCLASKSNKHIMIELYAKIMTSERIDTKQHFTFCDLFHAKPPYIKAVYDAAIWKSVQLFEYDSRRLLQEGRICRCIGTMRRDEKAWVMTVLNIWEATWEDVKWVEGIVNF